MRKLYALVAVGLTGVGLIMACGSDGVTSDFVDPTIDSGSTSSSGDPPILGGDSAPDPNAQAFTITPPDPVVTFNSGQPAPTVQFKAVTPAGVELPASFTIDRGEIGSVGRHQIVAGELASICFHEAF